MSGRLFPFSRETKLEPGLNFRLSEDEKENLARFAYAAGCGQATFLRRLLRMHAICILGEDSSDAPLDQLGLGLDPEEYLAALAVMLKSEAA